jgi:hypothetical protein
MMANYIDEKFIVKAVIKAMIDVLEIKAFKIDEIEEKHSTLVRVEKIP